MVRRTRQRRVEDVVTECMREAVGRGVPIAAVEYAAGATRRNCAGMSGPDAPRRSRAYFEGVVRRRLVRTHAGTLAAARLVAESVVADLVESGRTPTEAWEEITRGWVQTLPPELIDEYRDKAVERLCA